MSAAILAAAPARAHLRNYLDTYGYYTLDQGKSEMEVWTDRLTPQEGTSYWQNMTEVEYGITDRWSLGVYGVFLQDKGFSAWKVENRCRITQPGQLPVDVAGYVEYQGGVDDKDSDEWEEKIILSKELGSVNVSANGIVETERAPGASSWVTHPALALGTAYRTTDTVTLGTEVFLRQNESRVTPGVYLSLLPDLRLNLGVGFGIVPQADKLQLRSILELEF